VGLANELDHVQMIIPQIYEVEKTELKHWAGIAWIWE
jgi:hypothetical protein